MDNLSFITDYEIYKKVILEMVPQSKHFCWIATADLKDLYTHKGRRMVPFLEVLSDLAAQGVSIRLLHAKEPGPAFRKDFDRYPNLIDGIERILCPRVHFKTVVVDGRFAYSGSANLTGAGMGDIKRNVTDILSRVGLYHKRYEFPPSLSGGEQQRVAIARAVANRPAVLLADEPTGNLDPVVTRSILELLFKINAGGTAVLMATHDIDLVRSFGQRIIYLENGRIVEDKGMIYVGDLTQRIDEAGVGRRAERFKDRDITGGGHE